MRDTIDMAREVKMPYDFLTGEPINLEKLKAFEALVRADERQAAAPTVQEPDHGDELTIAYMSGVHRGKELAATVQKQVLGFEVVLDESLPPNTMKFVQPAPTVQEPVFCEHCGGNDEDPQDRCMDCTRPRWEPVTQELLNNQHPWLYEPMWIASKDRRVFAGFYEWRQGGKPDRFVTEDGDSWAFDASHVMPIVKPSPPEPEKGQP